MNKLKSIITLSAIFVSSGTYGVTCSNDPNDLFDDINLNVTIDGLSPEGTSLVGNSVQITGSAFWQAPQTMRNSPLNANIYFDESKVASSQTDTTGAGATGLSITFTKPSLERGHHSFELTT